MRSVRATAPPPSSGASTLRPIPTLYVPKTSFETEGSDTTFYEKGDDIGRVLGLGVVLVLVHLAGVVVALINAFNQLDRPFGTDTPVSTSTFMLSSNISLNTLLKSNMLLKFCFCLQSERVCTTALFCLWFALVQGICGTALQLAGSIIELIIGLLLIFGAIFRKPHLIAIWLIYHIFVILGCVVLFGVLFTALFVRHNHAFWTFYLFLIVPALLAVVYSLCWLIVLDALARMRRHSSNVFQCVV